MSSSKNIILVFLAVLATLPGIYVRLAHLVFSAPLMTLTAGVGILAASFLLLWACDTAQKDISPTLALAVVALIAVLPEYAVDMYFTWQAGKFPESHYPQYAIANMTGANRLLIGVGWSTIVAIFWWKTRRPVQIEKHRRLELFFLGLASLYAFVIPIKGSLSWFDSLILLGIYVWYIVLASRRPCEECEVAGPAELLASLSTAPRRAATVGMFLFAAGAILANAKPFCEGLVTTGRILGINEFLLVQWLAPIASEAPEFIVAIMFALRGEAGMALGSLISSKLNQWTLLVGMIPGAFALSHGTLQHPLPMNTFQMHEILLTAAQSLMAVMMLSTLRLTVRQAFLLFWLFASQLFSPALVNYLPGGAFLGLRGSQMHELFSQLYIMGAATLFIEYPGCIKRIFQALNSAMTAEPSPPPNIDG